MPLVLALSPVISNLLMLFFTAVAVIMILVILIQKPQGGGLSGAFGASSGGSGQTAFGAKTGDALTLMTIGAFVVFILTAILLVFTSRPPAAPSATPTAAPVGEQAPADTGVGEQPETLGDPADDGVVDPTTTEPAGAEGTTEEPTETPDEAPAGGPAETGGAEPAGDPPADPEPGS
ncbi:MAG: preprotein translocase subunit SecG [Phycisphaerales bacterium]